MKWCLKCSQLKGLEHFYIQKNGNPTSPCKACHIAATGLHQKMNRARKNEHNRKHKAKNRLRIRCENKAYRLANMDKVRADKREYMRRRTALLRQATPPWADKRAIKAFYKNRPAGHCVDHIVPLNHPNVTGLHVVDNLQYLTNRESLLKGASFDGTLENDSWRNAPDLASISYQNQSGLL